MIDAPVLLKDLQSQLRLLEADLRRRLEGDPLLRETLEREHAQALAVERTAASFGAWRDERVTQAAVAWLLACVFVRFAEDNHLVAEVHLAGPGEQGRMAADAQTHYFQQHPAHNDRDWLLSAFRALSAYPAAAPLFDERHNPLWQLPLSADAASRLLEFWRRRDANSGALVHDFSDPSGGTRFLGDLYQDLSEFAKKTYALLQTPEFVEEFLLDRTLEPAIAERGLTGLRMIDPTCGSGHFLIGAFTRLLGHWRAQEPGTDERSLVQRALDSVYGIDINPFAVAIARFRLTIMALKESGLHRLAEAPGFSMHLAVGDSLLHGRIEGMFSGMDDATLRLSDHAYSTEDADALRSMLDPDNPFDVVVGNPPYITPKDKALNAAYRLRYSSCSGKYALSAPFAERFFQLARRGDARGDLAGRVGMITSNSFMKREFGKKLVEQTLPTWDLTHVIDTSGAHIPGHGTPTVILLGRRRSRVLPTVRAVLGVSGMPASPQVWADIVQYVDSPGTQTQFVSVLDMTYERFRSHPWSIGGGGAAELKDAIEKANPFRLSDRVESMGFMSVAGDDDAYWPTSRTRAQRVDCWTGARLGNWSAESVEVLLPYDSTLNEVALDPSSFQHFWPLRTSLNGVKIFGGNKKERGLHHAAYVALSKDRYLSSRLISWRKVATLNDFVPRVEVRILCRDSAPVMTIAQGVDIWRLASVLNSSTACFWMKQVFHNKGSSVDSAGARQRLLPFDDFYEFDSSKLSRLPLPAQFPRSSTSSAIRAAVSDMDAALAEFAKTPTLQTWEKAASLSRASYGRTVALQEELDWECYELYGVLNEDVTAPQESVPLLAPGERAFEFVLARRAAVGEATTEWFSRHGSAPRTHLPEHWPSSYRQVVERRIALIEGNRDLALIERPECKRRWQSEPWEERARRAVHGWLLDRLEAPELWLIDAGNGAQPAARSVAEVADALREDVEFLSVLALHAGRPDADLVAELGKLVADEAVPYLAALRYTESGQRTRAEWERTWELQRTEDAGGVVGMIPVPAKYKDKDFQRKSYWSARGKLDVSKERFISYPLAGRDADPTVLLGWAGWDHLQQAQALATVIVERREVDGWGPERLVPLLAGLAELEPWLHQWHAGVDPAYGTTPGAFYTEFLEDTLRECELTRDDLGSWRPPAPSRGRPRKTR